MTKAISQEGKFQTFVRMECYSGIPWVPLVLYKIHLWGKPVTGDLHRTKIYDWLFLFYFFSFFGGVGGMFC